MMGDDFYAILKLVSGEEIFSLIVVDNDQEDDTVIVLQSPVLMWSNVTPAGTFIKVKPWMELPNEDIFMIRLDKVITMTESNDQKLINLYWPFHLEECVITLFKSMSSNSPRKFLSETFSCATVASGS